MLVRVLALIAGAFAAGMRRELCCRALNRS
jgi:hypothetical protein